MEATGICIFLHMCVYYHAHVPRRVFLLLCTRPGGRQESTPVLVLCEHSQLEMHRAGVPGAAVHAGPSGPMRTPSVSPSCSSPAVRCLHPLPARGCLPACPLCVCLSVSHSVHWPREAPEDSLKEWLWRFCRCSQELWDGQSHCHPFTSPGFSPGHNCWKSMFSTKYLTCCVSPPGRRDAPRGSRGPGGRCLAGGAPGVAGSVAQPPAGAQFWVWRAGSAWMQVHGSPDVALTLVHGHTSFLSLDGKHFTNEKNSHPFICRGRQRLKMQINTESW